MTTRLLRTLLAHSIVVLTVTAAGAANAQTVWHNDRDKTQVLGVRAGDMHNGTQLITYQVTGWSDPCRDASPYPVAEPVGRRS